MSVPRSELSLPLALSQSNLGYDSDVWDNYIASQIFVEPTAKTGKGLIALEEIAKDGAEAALASHNHTRVHGIGLVHDSEYLTMINEIVDKYQIKTCDVLVASNNQITGEIAESIKFFRKYNERTNDLFDQYQLVRRLCSQILAVQQKYKDEVLKHPEALLKLRIGMRCLDSAWDDAWVAYKQLDALRSELDTQPVFTLFDYVDFDIHGTTVRVNRDPVKGPSMTVSPIDTEEQDTDAVHTPESGTTEIDDTAIDQIDISSTSAEKQQGCEQSAAEGKEDAQLNKD